MIPSLVFAFTAASFFITSSLSTVFGAESTGGREATVNLVSILQANKQANRQIYFSMLSHLLNFSSSVCVQVFKIFLNLRCFVLLAVETRGTDTFVMVTR